MTDGSRHPGQDVIKLTATIIKILRLFAFSIILTFATHLNDRAKIMAKKTAGGLLETKVVVPKCNSCHFVLHYFDVYHFLNKQKTKTDPFKSVLIENGKNDCTYPHPLSKIFFNILSDKRASPVKHLPDHR